MKRIIVNYKKLTPVLLNLLNDKYPDGYGDNDIIVFDNHRNETIEAVEVRTEDAIYLVKVGSKLRYTMSNFNDSNAVVNAKGHVVLELDMDAEEE